jgi:heme-degrading monooxygenase HmoA
VSTLEGTVRSFLILQPRDGDYAALVRFFREHDVLGKAVQHAGAWSAEVHVPISGSGPVVVTAVWDSAEAYQGWRTHPIRAELGPITQVAEEDDGTFAIGNGVYEVVVAASRKFD